MLKHFPMGLTLLVSSFLTYCALKVAKDELERSAKMNERLDSIITDYYRGNLALAEVMSDLLPLLNNALDTSEAT